MRRFLQGLLVVPIGFVIGKWCQYASVEYLGDRLGFTGASIVGLAPFMAGIVVLKAKYPHVLAYRGRPQRS